MCSTGPSLQNGPQAVNYVEISNIFAKSSEDYGRTDLTKHRINTGESSPIKQAPHRIPLARRQEVETLQDASKPERNYCVTRKVAGYRQVEHFHHYLYGQEFILRSDHDSLQWLLNFKNPEGQPARWIQRLQDYQVKIQHCPGKRHQNADTLSRRPCVPQCGHCARADGVRQVAVQESDKLAEQHWTGQVLRKAQHEDRDLLPIINWKESDERPSWENVVPNSPKTKSLRSLWNSLTLTLTQHLNMFVDMNQETEHDSIGYSPSRMLFGHELRMPCDVLLGRPEETFKNTNEYISHLEERMLTIHQWAREKLYFSSEKMKDRYNVKTFKEGEMVWLHNPQRKKGLSPKLQYQWEGPYKIIKCLNDVIYRIQKTRTSKPKVVHYNRLAPFRGETIRLEIMGEELKEIKEKIEKLYDELFSLDEVDIDKESEACDSSMNKIGSLRVKIENERKLKDKLADIKQNGSQANIKLPQFDLPIYDGDMGNWINFKELFLTTIDAHPGLTNIQKLQYLNSAVKGEAARLIRGFPLLSENYGQAWSTLLSRYDNPRELAYAQVSKIFSLRAIKNPSAKCLHEFMDVCNEAIRNLETLELKRNKLVDVILVHFLQQKLSENLRLEWELSVDNTLPSYDKFIAFISRHARSMSCAVKECSKREETTGSRFPKCQSYGMLIEKSDTCILCKSKHHPLYMCNLFCKMPLKEKLNVVKGHKLCFNCLRKGHFSWNCRLNQRCKVCKGKHHTMIHYDKPSTESASAQVENTTPKEHESAINLTNTQQANCNDSHVLLATVRIKIKNGLGKLCTCRALLDSGSQVTMITKGCCERLGLVQRKSDRMIIGVGNTPVQHSSSTVSVTFCPLNNSEEFSVEAVVTGVLTSEIPNFRLKDPNWPTLKNLKLADPEFYIQAPIDMILGADIYTELMLNGSISLGEGLPMAINTRLGWVLLGKLMGTSESNTEVCNLSLQSEPELEFVMKRFWETESVPSPDLCTQDEDCERLFSNNHGRDSHGRYWVKLPFRQHRPLLGESREKALRRFLSLEGKLCKNVKLYDQYRGFMKEYEHLNHMERVPIAEVKRELCRCYYMPHHPVIREQSTTTKMRVVFDASAKSENNVSLNQFLHKGPKIQQDVFFILLRFRTYPVAITADIEKMYRQIRIHPEDADYQRILWRPSPEEPVVDYRLLTVTYGTTSAPFLAMRTLQQLAEDEGQNYPEISRVTLNDFYVDDLLTGAQTIAEAKELIDQLNDLMKKGGFHLRKWNSNCHEIVSHVEEMNEEKKINLEKGAISKILGIVWDHVQDTFRVNITLPEEVVTKRDLLSNIARIFDPLGFLSPTTVALKIIMQELWRGGTDWDEHIPNDIKEKWNNFRAELLKLGDLSFPRYVWACEKDQDVQLHGFCDASSVAYSAVCYLRTVSLDGQVHISMLAAKTRVAPCKSLTLPRLELCAALLLSQLYRSVVDSLKIDIGRTYLWSDSQISLSWIKSDPNRWKTFIHNRVVKIQQLSDRNSWRHVSGKDNPADCASRGIMPAALSGHTLWWQGPTWLKDNNFVQNQDNCYGRECHEEEKIPIAEEDKPKTAIITPFGLFEFNVMSFGLRNATATFQRFMHEVLRNLDFAFVYLDYILVASKTEEENYSHLETLFSRLNSYGLRINLSKSKFLVQEIDFLGYLITSHGVKPLPTKVKAILEYKKPKTVHELRIFLGMLNFYRTFLNTAAETQAILHEYLRGAKKKDRSEIKWTEKAEVQYEKFKQALANTALLAYPDAELPISLCTDASDRAVGSVLQQLDNNIWKPIAFFSKKLNPAQCNYSTYDRELLAIYLSIKFFKHLLEAREFTILTDHKPLIYAFKQKNEKASPRQLRHLQYISQFTTDIKYIKGTDNIVADALSRVDAITTIDYEEIAKEQTGDSELQNLISKNTSLKFKQCPLQSGNLLWCDVSTNNIRPFISIKFQMMVFTNFHELSHPGIKATTKQLTSRFIWPNMNKDIRKWAQACVNCQKCKVSIHTKSEIGKYQEVDERFSVVHIDLIGPLPPSNETFDFSTPNEWPKWRKKFERYLVVSGMKKREEADKIDLFMYLMGDHADDIFRTFKLEKEEEAKKIDSVLKAFDSHFCVRKNIIYERAKFNSRIQEDREPVDEFITSLYKLADSWEFEGLHEQLIRDRIVVGVRDKALSERMQLDSELTSEKAMKMVRQQEAVRQQQVDLQRPSTSQKVNQVKFNSKKQSPKQQQQPSRKKEKSAKTRSRCSKCGGFTHREGQACRAEGQRCNLCSKTGHFANCCPDKQAKTEEVKAVSELDEENWFSPGGQDFVWDCSQERAFRKLKELLTTQHILAAYDVREPTMVSSNASSYGLGAVLKQEGKNGIWRPVAYSSRAMTPTEKRYTQIEKEALAITWACERFQDFLLGKRFRIETDHKPLIPLFSTKELSSLTPRLQRFRMRMMRFGFEIVHIPGKELLDADALSRQPLLTTEGGENERPTSAHINAVLSCITDKNEMLTKIFEAQQEDTTLKAVVNYLEQGWPDKKKMSQALLSFWHVKDELGVQNGLLMRSCRLVIPASMKLEILDKLHVGHFGITKTGLRARETVWWPRISEEIAETVRKCSVCIKEAISKHEALIPTNFPTRPCQKIGMDLFKFENKWYLFVIDYYSRFPEMIELDRLTANVVVRSCKSIFARHGTQETVVGGISDPEKKGGEKEKGYKSRYDRRCGAMDMEELSEGDTVWITDMRIWGIVKQKASTPRSYMVDTPVGT
ncbi:hypothetical protein LAZ67_X001460, partial [Cordylochernes scorpioides]